MCDKASRALKATNPSYGPTTAGDARGQLPSRDELVQCLVANAWNKAEVGRIYGKHARQITRWMDYLEIRRPQE